MKHIATDAQTTPANNIAPGIDLIQINAPLRVIFGRRGPGGGEVFGSRAIPQAQPRTSKALITPGEWLIDVLAQPASSITSGIQLSDKCDPSGGFGRQPARAGRAFGSRAIPQAKPRTSETPNALPALAGCRGTKKRLRARWIRMPDRGSLWLLPSGPDQIRNMSSSEPIERARRSVYLTRSRPPRQDS